VGEKSWEESLQEVESTLLHLKHVLDDSAPARPTAGEITELNNVVRRIKLLAYAHVRAKDPRHLAWADDVHREMAGGPPTEGHVYSREELRERARVS
jgi:hypothetical protein